MANDQPLQRHLGQPRLAAKVTYPLFLAYLTYKAAALYERFAPEEARRILRRLEFHYTPKHGSWPNLGEIELSV